MIFSPSVIIIVFLRFSVRFDIKTLKVDLPLVTFGIFNNPSAIKVAFTFDASTLKNSERKLFSLKGFSLTSTKSPFLPIWVIFLLVLSSYINVSLIIKSALTLSGE